MTLCVIIFRLLSRLCQFVVDQLHIHMSLDLDLEGKISMLEAAIDDQGQYGRRNASLMVQSMARKRRREH